MRYVNLCLLVLFPVAWFAPLMRAALLPIFGMDEISVVTGLQSLWQRDIPLALAVTFLAIFAPYAKTIGLALLQFGLLSPRTLPVLRILGKLAMADVFLIALKAGGTGLNLPAASTVILLDPWWNPASEDQASDRAHRIGQTATVQVVRLVAAGTVEEQVLAMHTEKRELAERVLDGTEGSETLRADDLIALLTADVAGKP